jgi:NAD(P)-dependent dehydrogenase (short-subunit alcohol dehydrogenase family)/threonine dehydrogenase-like Zn-dependent dehydrogenase
MTMSTYDDFVDGTAPLPGRNVAWPLFGTGLENLGIGGEPVEWQMPEIAPDELLARVDACGLCFSDIKVLRLGPDHPRISGRDLKKDPVILGHEVALTIVKVGAERTEDFSVGDRFVVQADIYYNGEGLAFGYALHGGLQQFVTIPTPILDGDDGCYLIPIPDGIGYSEAALAEPWACVVCAFRVETRRQLKEGGTLAIVGGPRVREGFTLGELDAEAPETLIALHAPGAVLAELSHAERHVADEDELERLAEDLGGIDDLLLLDPTAEQVERLASLLADDGVLCLMMNGPLERPVEVDAGRIHYDGTRYVGASGLDIGEAYASTRSVAPVKGGTMLISGAAGPMGQMHVQRALEHPDGPSVVIATDIDDDRLATLPQRFGALAERNGRTLRTLNPLKLDPEAVDEQLESYAPEGFDDVVVLVPVPQVIAENAQFLGERGVYNIFAGVARGTMVTMDVSDVALRGVRYTGTSGSAIEDLQTTISMTEAGELAPNRAVAAVGGMDAAWDGLEAVANSELTGKAVIYPHVRGLPLTELHELADEEPEAAEKLDEAGAWTNEAEEALLRNHVGDTDAPCRHLTGRVALVTGAAQGLGEALAERLAREGADVCVADINLEGANETAERIAEATGNRGIAVAMDVTDEGSVAAAMSECVERLGGLDIVVSNAGVLIAGDTTEFEVADWRKVIEVNLVGYFIVAKQAAKIMLERGTKGAIVQINSKSGKKGSFKNSAYAASKFGGVGLTQSLALEFAEQGIRVNAVCPGNLLDSPLWVDSLYAQYAERWRITEEEVRQKYVDQVPMKRGCTYEDVGNVVVFLASDQASYMTGQAINVTGGQTLN